MIPMNAFAREDESLQQAEVRAFQRVLSSGCWILGQEVREFEARWANQCGTKHAVGVGNGMDALEIGLRALGLGVGDEIITTPMTAFATVLAIVRAGAVPVLADICRETACLDPRSVERCITKKTKGVIHVHLYGRLANVDELVEICSKHRVWYIEDAAQAHGAKWKGKPVGSFGVFSGWSFYPTKNLGCIGDGGALTTNSDELADKARMFRNYGQSVRYHHPFVGLNSRLDETQAAVLKERLNKLDAWNHIRRRIARAYWHGIVHPLIELLPEPCEADSHVNHLFVVRCAKRDLLAEFLKARGIETLIHYPVPVHRQPPMAHVRTDPAGLPVAENHAATCLSIPCNPFLTDDEIGQIIEAVNDFSTA